MDAVSIGGTSHSDTINFQVKAVGAPPPDLLIWLTIPLVAVAIGLVWISME